MHKIEAFNYCANTYQAQKNNIESDNNSNVFAKFADKDGIVDKYDVIYNDGYKLSEDINAFLKNYENQNWTENLIAQVNALLSKYNIALSSNNENLKQKQGSVDNNGVHGTYTIIEKDNNKYSLKVNMSVELYKNKAAQVFMRGSSSIINSQIKEENGYYIFKGIKSKSYNILTQKINMIAQNIAIMTEIYKDLTNKENSGIELIQAEKSFKNDYLNMLKQYNLSIDSLGNIK